MSNNLFMTCYICAQQINISTINIYKVKYVKISYFRSYIYILKKKTCHLNMYIHIPI